MKYLYRAIAACCAALVLAGCTSMGGPSPIADKEGQSVYTQRNLWFHEGEHITTNYQAGTKLDVNSRVTITGSSGETIQIETADGTQYTIVNVADYTKKDIAGIYDRYFAKSKVDLDRFSAKERRAIDNGRINKGVSKEALLIARGYPPAHETPSTDSDSWRYWKKRHDTMIVEFENGRVAQIKD